MSSRITIKDCPGCVYTVMDTQPSVHSKGREGSMELPEFSEAPGRPGRRSEITWHYGRWISHEKPPRFWLSRPLGTLRDAEVACREANAAMRGAHEYRIYSRLTRVDIVDTGNPNE